jgi:cellulase
MFQQERQRSSNIHDRFKIEENGYNSGDWATSQVIADGGLQAITIPKCIPNGQYLLRAEMIALHAASSVGGAQLYVRIPSVVGTRTSAYI